VRRSQQVRPTPRAGSATSLLLAILPSAPVLTGKTAVRILGISAKAALEGLQELQAAGILHPKAIGRGATAYLAEDLLNLVTFAERRLASTHFDTRLSAPNYPVPALPQK
jgi:hypothetical protein